MALDAKLLAVVQAIGTDIKALLAAAPPKGIAGWCAGKPAASEIICGGKAPYAFTIVQANCRATASVAATASTVFVIKKNGTQIGTITFGAGATAGTFNITTAAVALDDRITVTAPATADATLADIDVLIRA